jgi:hypothetical protein
MRMIVTARHIGTTILALTLWVGGPKDTFADSYTIDIQKGFNLISCPVLATSDNSLGSLLSDMPANAQFWAFDNGSGSCLPSSVFSAGGGWSRNYTFLPGVGAFFYSPMALQITFAGVPMSARSYPAYLSAPGSYLLSDTVPNSASSFLDVVGRAPMDGEAVNFWDQTSKDYLRTEYDGASGTWSQGAPALGVGQAAFFELHGTPVPEGSGNYCLLAGLFLGLVGLWQRSAQCRMGVPARVIARSQHM